MNLTGTAIIYANISFWCQSLFFFLWNFLSELDNRILDYFSYPANIFINVSLLFKTEKRTDKLKKTDVMENNKTKPEQFIQLLFQFADTSKNLSQRFKVQEFHTNRNLISDEIHL